MSIVRDVFLLLICQCDEWWWCDVMIFLFLFPINILSDFMIRFNIPMIMSSDGRSCNISNPTYYPIRWIKKFLKNICTIRSLFSLFFIPKYRSSYSGKWGLRAVSSSMDLLFQNASSLTNPLLDKENLQIWNTIISL